MHCHSTFIVWEEEEEEKGKEVRKERKGSGHMGQRRTEGEMKNHTGCHLGCRDWSPCACRALMAGLLGGLRYVEGTSSEGGPDEAHQSG